MFDQGIREGIIKYPGKFRLRYLLRPASGFCATRTQDETYYVLPGELKVEVGDQSFLLRSGDTLFAPRNIPNQLKNTGRTENRYLLVFSPAGFENFIDATAVTAPECASAPTE